MEELFNWWLEEQTLAYTDAVREMVHLMVTAPSVATMIMKNLKRLDDE